MAKVVWNKTTSPCLNINMWNYVVTSNIKKRLLYVSTIANHKLLPLTQIILIAIIHEKNCYGRASKMSQGFKNATEFKTNNVLLRPQSKLFLTIGCIKYFYYCLVLMVIHESRFAGSNE